MTKHDPWLTWPRVILFGILCGLIATIIIVLYLNSIVGQIKQEQSIPIKPQSHSKELSR